MTEKVPFPSPQLWGVLFPRLKCPRHKHTFPRLLFGTRWQGEGSAAPRLRRTVATALRRSPGCGPRVGFSSGF